MDNNEVYALFEDIKNGLKSINSKLENVPKVSNSQAPAMDLASIKDIHRHIFDIKSNRVFSLLVGMGIVCSLSIWGNIELWKSKRQYADDALKFRVIRSWEVATPIISFG